MGYILDAITDWLREALTEGIMSNITGLFSLVNEQIAEVSGQVGTTPQGWNTSIYNMIRTLSENVILPIAGVILAIVATLELIQLITDRNNMHEIDTWIFFKWVFKTASLS